MKKINIVFSFVFVLLLVSCADSEVTQTTDEAETNVGPFYAQFLACNAGPDFWLKLIQIEASSLLGVSLAPVCGQNSIALAS